MMNLTMPDIYMFMLFVVPGFVSVKVYGMLIASARRGWQETLLDAISYSCVNFALVSWPLHLATQSSLASNSPGLYYALLALFFILLPACWPFVGNWLRDRRLFRGALLAPDPTAWDQLFRTSKKAMWVVAYMKDGTRLAGIYGEGSGASSYPEPQDIYLQKRFAVGDDGRLQPVPRSRGVWLSKDSFDFLEFFADTEGTA